MKNNTQSTFSWKPFLFHLAIPLLVGGIAALLINGHTDQYASLPKPPLSPPMWVFPVAWSILYVLMGISSYLLSRTHCSDRNAAFTLYGCQLVLNFIWPLLFFNAQSYLISFLCLVLLWILVLVMMVRFYRCSTLAAWLQLPYLLWLTFAGYLNFFIWQLQ